jgi:hypothetical protein
LFFRNPRATAAQHSLLQADSGRIPESSLLDAAAQRKSAAIHGSSELFGMQ